MPGRLQRATGVFWEGDDRYRVFYTTTVSEEGETDEREDDTITHTFHPHTLLAAAYVQGREGMLLLVMGSGLLAATSASFSP